MSDALARAIARLDETGVHEIADGLRALAETLAAAREEVGRLEGQLAWALANGARVVSTAMGYMVRAGDEAVVAPTVGEAIERMRAARRPTEGK